MASESDLVSATQRFFALHWYTVDSASPSWDNSYQLQGAIPAGDKPGCYALMKANQVFYIGSGASRGGGIYVNHGLGKRLSAHVLAWDRSVLGPVSNRRYMFQSRWVGVTALLTIGFPDELAYLSLALEAYLIINLSPPANSKSVASAL